MNCDNQKLCYVCTSGAVNRSCLAHAVMQNMQAAVAITDLEGHVVAVNAAFTRVFGYSEEEVIGQTPRMWKSGIHSADYYRELWSSVSELGTWQGEIHNRRKNGELFPAWLTISSIYDEHGEVMYYFGVVADMSHKEGSPKALEYLAHYDALTGVPNRVLLYARLKHAIEHSHRTAKPGAVLFLDLDRFKNVNDSLGHSAGDELLRQVAARLKKRLRLGDTLARLGGDEFVIVLEELSDIVDAHRVAMDCIDHLRTPFKLYGNNTVYIGASIGLALFPEHAETADALIQYADTALYAAKEAGRGTYAVYSSLRTAQVREKLSIEGALRKGLEHNEFVLHYQPLIELESGRVHGFEALVRWQSPDLGLVPPDKFIPIAEESGIIIALGDIILRLACGQMKQWLDQGYDLDCIAVNLSPRQFHLVDIVDRIETVLQETGLLPEYLELEITESALMERGGLVEEKMAALNEMGIRLNIDDFGTGYSSLAYLKRFPINKLKVDRSFVRDIPHDHADMAITATVVSMAKNLNLQALAEGVETPDQASYLQGIGCRYGQGYLFSRPLTVDSAQKLLEDVRSGTDLVAALGGPVSAH